MRYSFSKGPWNISTIVLISILFTPIIGGILAGANQKRLGFPHKRWGEYTFSLLAFVWYSVYFYFIPHGAQAIIIPPVAVIYSALFTPLYFLVFLALPSAVFIHVIARRQRISCASGSHRERSTAPWWLAYLFGTLLIPILGICLFIADIELIDSGILEYPRF